MAQTAAKVAESELMESDDDRRFADWDFIRDEYEAEITEACAEVDRKLERLRQLEAVLTSLDPGISVRLFAACKPTPVCHRGRVTTPDARNFPGSLSAILTKHLNQEAEQNRRADRRGSRRGHRLFGSAMPVVLRSIARAYETYGRLSSLCQTYEFTGPDEVEFRERERAFIFALRALRAVQSRASFEVLLFAQVLKRERRRRHSLLRNHLHNAAFRRTDLDVHDPPGQVVIASPHVTNAPPRLRVAPSCDVLATAA
jgi:hypothetical protein